jgi:hypothetical protein
MGLLHFMALPGRGLSKAITYLPVRNSGAGSVGVALGGLEGARSATGSVPSAAAEVAKWRQRETIQDAPMGPKRPQSTVLTAEEETAVVAFRKYTLLPLDNITEQ